MNPRYSRWEDAMIAQARVHEFSESNRGRWYLEHFFEDINSKHREEYRRDPRLLTEIQLRTLREAEPTYVSSAAFDLIDHARQTFEPEPALPSDPWTPVGFVLLPRPMILHDAPPTELYPMRSPTGDFPVRAIGWTSLASEDLSVGAFWISYYIDVDDEIENARAAGVADRWDTDAHKMRALMPLSLAHQFQWQWGTTPGTLPDELDTLDGETAEATAIRGREQIAAVQTLWRIGSQFRPVPERAPRGIRRDAKRRGVDHENVNVIVLRRNKLASDREEATGRQLTVQHIVRGFWRKQHYKTGPRQIWISPYIRGSDDLPFKEPSLRAWEFKR